MNVRLGILMTIILIVVGISCVIIGAKLFDGTAQFVLVIIGAASIVCGFVSGIFTGLTIRLRYSLDSSSEPESLIESEEW